MYFSSVRSTTVTKVIATVISEDVVLWVDPALRPHSIPPHPFFLFCLGMLVISETPWLYIIFVFQSYIRWSLCEKSVTVGRILAHLQRTSCVSLERSGLNESRQREDPLFSLGHCYPLVSSVLYVTASVITVEQLSEYFFFFFCFLSVWAGALSWSAVAWKLHCRTPQYPLNADLIFLSGKKEGQLQLCVLFFFYDDKEKGGGDDFVMFGGMLGEVGSRANGCAIDLQRPADILIWTKYMQTSEKRRLNTWFCCDQVLLREKAIMIF